MSANHRAIMLKTFAARGMSISDAEAQYEKLYGKQEPIRQSERPAVAVPVVAAAPAKIAARTEAAPVRRAKTEDTVKFTLLERIEAQLGGTPCAYDGRFCVWITNDGGRTRDSFDVRDIAQRMGVSPDTVVDALPTFAPVKRGRAAEAAEESNDDQQ